MHRLKRALVCAAVAVSSLGITPVLLERPHTLRANGSELLYLRLWTLDACWGDCFEGTICCKLVYLPE